MSTHSFIWNERLKAISATMFNLATALFIAMVAKVWKDGPDLPALSWFLGSLVLFFFGHQVLYLLDVEP